MEESGPSVQAPGATLATTPRQPALPINDISAEKAPVSGNLTASSEAGLSPGPSSSLPESRVLASRRFS